MSKKSVFILALIISIILLSPACFAGNFVVGWVKAKFGIENPQWQCEVNLVRNEECINLAKGSGHGTHYCQLYKGYDAGKHPFDQCEFCVKRSRYGELYGSDCYEVKIGRSLFAGEDLIGNIAETNLALIDNRTAMMDPMSHEVISTEALGRLGVLKDWDGTVLYTRDGRAYFDSISNALAYEPEKPGWFSRTFFSNPSAEDAAAYYVYSGYRNARSYEVEAAYEAYTSAIDVPLGADIPAQAIIKTYKHVKKDAFLKVARKYNRERGTNSVQNMHSMYGDDSLAELKYSSTSRDIPKEAFLMMLEEAYHRMSIGKAMDAAGQS